MTQNDTTRAAAAMARGRVLAAVIALTLAAGAIEIVVLMLQRRADPLTKLSDDYFWMAPAALLTAVAAALLPGLALSYVVPSPVVARLVFVAPAALVAMDLLMLIPRMSHYAAAILALGIAWQLSRLIAQTTVARPMPRRLWLHASIASLAVIGLAGVIDSRAQTAPPTTTATSPSSPNVILITLDTVRAQSLSLYGYVRPTTPALDRFAARGVVFDQAYATAPWTLPSHASLFTGRWPHELSANYRTVLDAAHPTLAEVFAARGYATAGFAANLGYCSRDTGLGRGFQHYEDYPRSIGQVASSSTVVRTVANNFRLRELIENDEHLNRVDGQELNRRFLSWLSTRGDAPFFAFLNYFDAHEPYLAPPPFAGRFGPVRARGRYSPLHHWLWNVAMNHRPLTEQEVREEKDAYDAGLLQLDTYVGELFDALQGRGLLEDTIIVITADHGEELGEHQLFDHGYSLYRPSLQVPLVIVAPGRAPAGRRVATPVSLRDVPATILAMAGDEGGRAFPGRSLDDVWQSEPPIRHDAILSEVSQASGQPEWFPVSGGDMRSAVYAGVHCISGPGDRREAYDIDLDPWEQRDLTSTPARAEAVAACHEALDRQFPALPRSRP